MPRSALLALSLLLLTAGVAAHEGSQEKRERLTSQLEEVGPDAGLLVKRADVSRRLELREEAFADLVAAEALDPATPRLHLVRARLLMDVGWWPAARLCLQRHVELHGADTEVLGLMADAAFGAGAVDEALELRAQCLAVDPQPTPETYLQSADELLRAGGASAVAREAALAVIDAGIERLGPVVSLQLRAVELERAAERWDAALARIDAVVAAAPRKETWLSQRGDLLAEAGRHTEARAAWQAAQVALDTLKPHRRSTAMVEDLQAHLTASLAGPSAGTTSTSGADR